MNLEITRKMINDFYNCFETGYDFEYFLKKFLEDLGFTDIKVTKRSGDNGIDLIAYKNSISDLDIDPEKYIIQAKRYKNTVPVKEIREFKGTASYEKRNTASFVPSWKPENCIQCNLCSYVCPHAVIRPIAMNKTEVENAPSSLKHKKMLGVSELEFSINILLHLSNHYFLYNH